MLKNNKSSALILGISFVVGLAVLAYLLDHAAIQYKEYERVVTVKGLSEKEFTADIVIWPIQFTLAGNDLGKLYGAIEDTTQKIKLFLYEKGIDAKEISITTPSITDKSAQQYGGEMSAEFRYSAVQTVTVYSDKIDHVREVMGELSALGKQGIVITGDGYLAQTEYLFTRLNAIKPDMIEEATRKAREVAEKFASDSKSKLGKIKKAYQGQFSISERDRNNPHIKKIRVVSTVTYYLSD